jgi:glutamate carboxypeptidase
MMDGSDRAAAILAHIEGERDAMVEMLVNLASHESPTDVVESQEGVQGQLIAALGDIGFVTRRVSGKQTGGHLFAVPHDRERGRPAQLLMGHTDTVWPMGTLATMPVTQTDGILSGPGTFDMKGGLVQGIFALRALKALGLEPPATPVWLINSDEETGSPESRRYVRMVARRVARAFILEPALGPAGDLKTARKGVGRFLVRIHGKAAHSGLDPTGGASAIQELANVIHQLHALTDLERGVTINVGVVSGGTRPNVKAALAEADVDVRVLTMADGEAISLAIRGMTAKTDGTSLEISGGMEAPPLERTPRNRKLWEAAQAAATRLGIEVGEAISGGGSDGNTTSQYTATLDGLGPLGDGAHARHEHVIIAQMPERAALLAELLMSPIEQDV